MQALEQRIRDRRAELELLELYDRRRQLIGYDYGAGQRNAELSRRRRELEQLEDRAARTGCYFDGIPTFAETTAAFDRVLAPKLRRLERESYRHGSKATDRTLRILVSMRRTVAPWVAPGSRRPADEDRAGGRNTLTRFASGDLAGGSL